MLDLIVSSGIIGFSLIIFGAKYFRNTTFFLGGA